MKTSISLLALALCVTAPAFAKSTKAVKACAFGENTADLSEMLDSKERGRTFYKGEELTFSNKQRLQGITSSERKMILQAVVSAAGGSQSEEEALNDFSSADGYITYFTHGTNNREFAQVASFPGDNEFGLIFEIKPLKRKGEYKILSVAAVISDGDLEECQVEKE